MVIFAVRYLLLKYGFQVAATLYTSLMFKTFELTSCLIFIFKTNFESQISNVVLDSFSLASNMHQVPPKDANWSMNPENGGKLVAGSFQE